MSRITVLCLLALAACCRSSASRDAEAAALRARVERLERETAEDRAKLAEDLGAMREDVSALRASLEEANQHLAVLSGQDLAAVQSAKPAKSPRAALRDSLHEMLEMSRQALERLNQQLEKALSRSQKPAAPTAPAVPDTTGAPGK